MATSGTLKSNTTYESYFWVKWSQKSQSVADNKTTINWSCGVECGHSFYLNAVRMSAVSINGKKVYSGGTYSDFAKGSHTIASGTLDIPHNTDGTKSFTISSFTGWLWENHNYSASAKSYSLTAIPRMATVTSATDFTDEQNPTIQFSNPAGFSVMPYFNVYKDADAKEWVFGITRDIGSYTSPYTFELTEEEREQLRSATNGQQTYTVYEGLHTYQNGESIGYSSLAKTLSFANANPVFTAEQVTVADTNTDVTNVTGDVSVIVLGLSQPKVAWTKATARKRASISKYILEWQGASIEKTASENNADFSLTTSGNTTLKVTAVDSRGLTTVVSKEVKVFNYNTPNMAVFLGRINNYESETAIIIDGSFSSIEVNDVEKNSITNEYRYKEAGGTYGGWITIGDDVRETVILDNQKEFIVECRVTDKFGYSYSKEYTVPTGKFPMFIDTGLNAVGINEFPKTGEALRVTGGVTNLLGGGTISNQLVGDILQFALNCKSGITPILTGESSTNTPSFEFQYSSGFIHKRSDTSITIYLHAFRLNTVAMNTYYEGEWLGWTVKADTVIERGGDGEWYYEKWQSGWCNCWKKQRVDDVVCSTAWGNGYVSANIDLGSYPFPFSARPIQNISIHQTSSGSYMIRYPYGDDYSNTASTCALHQVPLSSLLIYISQA